MCALECSRCSFDCSLKHTWQRMKFRDSADGTRLVGAVRANTWKSDREQSVGSVQAHFVMFVAAAQTR